jgi:hypothetical protein
VLRDGRLHQVQAYGGAADAEVRFHQRDEGSELAKLHITNPDI